VSSSFDVTASRPSLTQSSTTYIDAEISKAVAAPPRSNKPQKGVTMRYQGEKFLNADGFKGDFETQTNQFKANFSATGALVLRQNLGARQTSALLRASAERPEIYNQSPIQNPGKGADESGLLKPSSSETDTYKDTLSLLEIAHSPIGKGKVINEKSQPIAHHNKRGFTGQHKLFDIIHSSVWNTGTGLPRALAEQGFQYVSVPSSVSPAEHAAIAMDIEKGRFNTDTASGTVEVAGHSLATKPFVDIEITPEPESRYSSKLNVTLKGQSEVQPSGFIIGPSNKGVSQYHSDGILKITRIAKGGFYGLNEKQQAVLLSGVSSDHTDSGQSLFTQNAALNAFAPIFSNLEKLTGFSVVEAVQKHIVSSAKRLQKTISSDQNLKEDFLVGNMLNEMAQSLRAGEISNAKVDLPDRFQLNFHDNNNVAKAIAYAFDLVDANGQRLLSEKDDHLDSLPISDKKIKGALVDPTLDNPKHTAALIAASVLVSEQSIIDNMLGNVSKGGKSSYSALKQILGSDSAEIAMQIAHGIKPSKMGRQFPESEELVSFIRGCLKTDLLIGYSKSLASGNERKMNFSEISALKTLRLAGEQLNRYAGSNAHQFGSQGISKAVYLLETKLT
jgi:hypothetical protein